MNHVQDMNEHIAQRSFDLFSEAINLENACLQEVQQLYVEEND